MLANSDAVLSFSITSQRLQAFAGELSEIAQTGSHFKDSQPFLCRMGKGLDPRDPLTLGEALGSFVAIAKYDEFS